MSGWTPDAAAPSDAAAAGSFAPARRRNRGGGEVFARVARRWWVVAAGVVAALVVALIYLATATPTYTATAVIATQYGAAARGEVAPDVFLETQRKLVESPATLAAAGARAEQLHVTTSKGDGTITIAYDSDSAATAARAANALADAYVASRGGAQSQAAKTLADLGREREQKLADRAAAGKALAELRPHAPAGGTASGVDAARLAQLTAALTAARSELAAADADAAQASAADPQKLRQLVEARRAAGTFAALDQQRDQANAELAQLLPKLEAQRRTMLPQHPVLQATQRRVEQLQQTLAGLDKQYAATYLASVQEQRQAAQRKVDELQAMVKLQQQSASSATAQGGKVAGLEAAVKSADAALADIDQRLRGINLGGDALGAGTKVILPAAPPGRPSRPDRNTVLPAAAAIGLLIGLALAAFVPSPR